MARTTDRTCSFCRDRGTYILVPHAAARRTSRANREAARAVRHFSWWAFSSSLWEGSLAGRRRQPVHSSGLLFSD
jgi:hypothetical protein